jgi:protein ImuB
LAGRTPPPELATQAELDPPAEQVDRVAFVAKALADELHQGLAVRGLACTRVSIEAETEHGEHLARQWRHDGALDAGAIAERVRWQLDSWLTDRAGSGGTTGGLTLLRLVPDEVRPDLGRQLGFWGGATDGDRRVGRILARVQGMLGPYGVMTGVVGGGRDPGDQVRLVPWGDPREPARPGLPRSSPPQVEHHRTAPGVVPVGTGGTVPVGTGGEVPPWPGRLPGPAPSVLHRPPRRADVLDADRQPVEVTGRGVVSSPPVAVVIATGAPGALVVATGGPVAVIGWGGPWPVEERWWDPTGRRRARFQVALADGSAHLLVREGGRWWVEATYD